MTGRNNKGVMAALDALKGRSSRARRSEPQDCGDIGLSIGRDGTWYYQGSPISRLPLVKLFASVLRLEDDGRYYLVTPVERVVIEVEDVPFLAVAMERTGKGKGQLLSFTTNLGESVEAGPDHPIEFREDAEGAFTPYILVKNGLKARLTRPVYYELVASGTEETTSAGERPGVWSGGMFFLFPAGPEDKRGS
jgi:hypothetical protein